MMRRIFSHAAFVCALAGAHGGTLAQPAPAHVLDTGGTVWRNAYGECWRAGHWSPERAIAGCDGAIAPPPAPAPAPAAAPAPVPAPVAAAPAPAPVPPADSDGDGVPNSRDRCPGTPAGARVDANGCELDSDGDGVVDRLDRCPGTKPGAKVDANGCEIPEIVTLKGVNFATNSATLTPGSSAILDDVAAALAKRGDVRVEVAGHTDSSGSAARNLTLSQQRADSVMRYLVSRGVSTANLTARGYGKDSPIADNKTASGRAANRRVELRILK